MSEFNEDWYEDAPDVLAPLRKRGVMAGENKTFDEDPDLKYHDNLTNALNDKGSDKPNQPSQNYDDFDLLDLGNGMGGRM